MNPLDNLLHALKTSGIEVLSVDGNHVKLERNYEVEVETNGMLKLLDDGYIVAPFSDAESLCKFIVAAV